MFGIKNYYFLVPLCGMIPWTGMLIAMLICWGVQGRPIYSFIHHYMDPVYISYIGATNLQPLFISCAGWQGLFYVLTILTEYRLRRTGKLQYWFKKIERNFMLAGVVFGAIGQLGILLCSCFNTKDFNTLHHVFLGVFIIGLLLSMLCIMVQYCLMGLHYRKIHVDHKYMNKFTKSFYLKLVWTILAAVFAACFGLIDSYTISGRFEWTLAFWYTFLWLVFGWDLFSAAKANHKNQPYIQNWNDKGFYLYDKNFGDDGSNKTDDGAATTVLSQNNTYVEENNAVNTQREFTDEELAQYPITQDSETYPIPHGQQVPVYDRTA